MEELIREKYTKLQGASFELMMTCGSGRSSYLLRIPSSEAIADALTIKIACRAGSVVYIRPSVDLSSVSSTTVSKQMPYFDSNGQIDAYGTEPAINENYENQKLNVSSPETCTGVPSTSDRVRQPEPPMHTADQYESDEELVTIDDLRHRIFNKNPGVQPIFVGRDNFAIQVIRVYKHPKFKLLMAPDVTFKGEQACWRTT